MTKNILPIMTIALFTSGCGISTSAAMNGATEESETVISSSDASFTEAFAATQLLTQNDEREYILELEQFDSPVRCTEIYKEDYSNVSSIKLTDAEYNKAIDKINQKFEEYRNTDLSWYRSNNTDEDLEPYHYYDKTYSLLFSQDVYGICTEENDKFIFIVAGRTQEETVSHPNNYYDSFVISKQTKTFAKLSDANEIDDKTIDEITKQIYEEHPEKDIDVLRNDIGKAIDNDEASWRIDGSNLIIWFEYEYITGAGHGDGGYDAIIPID